VFGTKEFPRHWREPSCALVSAHADRLPPSTTRLSIVPHYGVQPLRPQRHVRMKRRISIRVAVVLRRGSSNSAGPQVCVGQIGKVAPPRRQRQQGPNFRNCSTGTQIIWDGADPTHPPTDWSLNQMRGHKPPFRQSRTLYREPSMLSPRSFSFRETPNGAIVLILSMHGFDQLVDSLPTA
jgi:hypothetical protein